MTDSQDEENKKTLSLSSKTLELKKTLNADQIRQSFSHGRSKTVAVEIKRKRVIERPNDPTQIYDSVKTAVDLGLTSAQLETKIRLLQEARDHDVAEQQRREQEELKRLQQEEIKRQAEEHERLSAAQQEEHAQNIKDAETAPAPQTDEHKTSHESPGHKTHKDTHIKKIILTMLIPMMLDVVNYERQQKLSLAVERCLLSVKVGIRCNLIALVMLLVVKMKKSRVYNATAV